MTATAERLERAHFPVTDVFPHPGGDPSRSALSEEQVAFFQEQGYVKGGRVLDERQVEALRDGLEAIRLGENPRTGELYEIDEDYRREPERNIFHILGAWLIDDAFHDLLWHPAIMTKAAQLLGVEHLRFWHDQVFYKPPKHPGVVTWHQGSDRPRRGVALNFMRPDTRSADGTAPLLTGVPLIPEGQVIEGDYFPLLT